MIDPTIHATQELNNLSDRLSQLSQEVAVGDADYDQSYIDMVDVHEWDSLKFDAFLESDEAPDGMMGNLMQQASDRADMVGYLASELSWSIEMGHDKTPDDLSNLAHIGEQL
ncbi:unnamed protein product, partial [marine sediment metagenome]